MHRKHMHAYVAVLESSQGIGHLIKILYVICIHKLSCICPNIAIQRFYVAVWLCGVVIEC